MDCGLISVILYSMDMLARDNVPNTTSQFIQQSMLPWLGPLALNTPMQTLSTLWYIHQGMNWNSVVVSGLSMQEKFSARFSFICFNTVCLCKLFLVLMSAIQEYQVVLYSTAKLIRDQVQNSTSQNLFNNCHDWVCPFGTD